MSENNNDHAGIIAGIAGGVIFLFFLLLLNINLFISLGAGAAAFGVAFLFFRTSHVLAGGMSVPEKIQVEQVIADGLKKQQELQVISKGLKAGLVKKRLENISSFIGRIVSDVRDDNKDYKIAGRFLDYYADTAVKIARLYSDVSSKAINSNNFRSVEAKVETNLETLEKAFEVQLAKLQDDNLMSLDTELTVLERTIQLEGIQELINDETATRVK